MVATLTPPTLHTPLPAIAGNEGHILNLVQQNEPVFLGKTNLNLADLQSGFANALHMHQPIIPAGREGELISNLQYMYEHPGEGDNHNA
ncbi:MAG: glycosyl hydrolase family 57, partial [Microcystaceae cyanobacterium]